MSKMVDFGEFGQFSIAEVTFIIEMLAALLPLNDLQEAFFKFTNSKRALPGPVIQQIQLKYADKIKRQNELYLSNVQGNPLAHLRIRIRYCVQDFTRCYEARAITYFKEI